MSSLTGSTQLLHASESGVSDLHPLAGPSQFANQLARYICCASTIRVRVLEQYDRAPSINAIRDMQTAHKRERKRFREAVDELGGEPTDRFDFRVTGLVALPKKSQKREYTQAPRAPKAPPLMPADIVAAIAAAFGISAQELTGPSGPRRLMDARRTAAYVFRMRGNSYPAIGKWLGGRDHSTMILQCKQFEQSAVPEMRAIAARFIGERE